MSRALLIVALLASTAPADAQSLGRLFYTPEQRQAITGSRLRGAPAAATSIPGAEDPTTGPATDARAVPMPGAVDSTAATATMTSAGTPPREVVLNGVVDRPGGRVAWLGGVPVEDGARWMGYRVHVELRGVRLHRSGQSVRVLGVGQRLNLITGEVHGALAADAVRRSGR